MTVEDPKYTCSECGKQFITGYLPSVYPWRISKTGHKTINTMQCDYNCHNHACLRFEKLGYMTLTKFQEEVKRSEENMRLKGKTILHPINTKSRRTSRVD